MSSGRERELYTRTQDIVDDHQGWSQPQCNDPTAPEVILMSGAAIYGRTRKPNYTQEETTTLLEQLNFHKNSLFRRGQPGALNYGQRAEIWASVVHAVNAVPNSPTRTVEELKHRWKDMSHRARTALRNIQHAEAKGEKITKPPTLYFDLILNILGDEIPHCLTGFKSELFPLSSNESENSAPFLEFTDSVTADGVNGEVDTKPDVAALNWSINMDKDLSGDSDPHTHSSETLNLSTSLCTPTSQHNLSSSQERSLSHISSGSKGAHESFSLTQMSKRDSEGQCINSLHSQECGKTDNYVKTSKQKPSQSSLQNGLSVRRKVEATKKKPGNSIPAPKKMRTDEFQRDAHSMADSKPFVIERNIDGCVEETPGLTPHMTYPRPKKRQARAKKPTVQPQCLEELKRQYFHHKIDMIKEKAACFKLQQAKMKLELQLLEQQLMTYGPAVGSQSSPIHSTHEHDDRNQIHGGHDNYRLHENFGVNLSPGESNSAVINNIKRNNLNSAGDHLHHATENRAYEEEDENTDDETCSLRVRFENSSHSVENTAANGHSDEETYHIHTTNENCDVELGTDNDQTNQHTEQSVCNTNDYDAGEVHQGSGENSCDQTSSYVKPTCEDRDTIVDCNMASESEEITSNNGGIRQFAGLKHELQCEDVSCSDSDGTIHEDGEGSNF